MNEKIATILLSPLFLISLGLLLLNDFFLKAQFHNFLTGKISDFTGLFVFALFFMAFFPKRKLLIVFLTGILFAFWKSSYSEVFINYWNSLEILSLRRTVDETDLLALSVLPLASFYYKHRRFQQVSYVPLKQAAVNGVILLSVFAFIATSVADEHSFWLDRRYQLNITRAQLEDFLTQYDKVRDFTSANSNVYPNIEHNPNQFHVFFNLKHKICDTNEPMVYISFIDHRDKIGIESASIRVRCEPFADRNTNAAVKKYEPIVKDIFENEVIDKLKEYSQQKH